MINGVPVGMAVAMLDWQSNPCPIDFTRMVAVGGMKGADTHGPLATGGGGKAQPATRYGTLLMGTGVPMIFTLGFGAGHLA